MFIYLNFDRSGSPPVKYYVRSPLPSSFWTTEVDVEILIQPPLSPQHIFNPTPLPRNYLVCYGINYYGIWHFFFCRSTERKSGKEKTADGRYTPLVQRLLVRFHASSRNEKVEPPCTA